MTNLVQLFGQVSKNAPLCLQSIKFDDGSVMSVKVTHDRQVQITMMNDEHYHGTVNGAISHTVVMPSWKFVAVLGMFSKVARALTGFGLKPTKQKVEKS